MKRAIFLTVIVTMVSMFSVRSSNAGAIGDMIVQENVYYAQTQMAEQYRGWFTTRTNDHIILVSQVSKGLLEQLKQENSEVTRAEIGLYIGLIQATSRAAALLSYQTGNASLIETAGDIFKTASATMGFCTASSSEDSIAKGDVEALIKKLNRIVRLASQI